jgi:hypothetical protein
MVVHRYYDNVLKTKYCFEQEVKRPIYLLCTWIFSIFNVLQDEDVHLYFNDTTYFMLSFFTTFFLS